MTMRGEKRNLFQVLGLDENASEEDIRRAYKKLVLKHHPDRGSQADRERFLDIQEAYHILCDPEKRKAYQADRRQEQARQARTEANFNAPQFRFKAGRSTHLDFLEELLSEEMFWPSEAVSTRSIPALEITLTPSEAARGVSLPVELPIDALCHYCKGTGGSGFYPCSVCGGSGYQRRVRPIMIEIPAGIAGDTCHTVDLEGDDGRRRQLRIFIMIG